MRLANVLSIDLEEWFCAYTFNGVIDRSQWDSCESRVEKSTCRILGLLERYNVEATFFVLGWVAERKPELVRAIYRAGHEIASHGYSHRLLTAMRPEEFSLDLERSIAAIGDITGERVCGFRAPSFSLTPDSLWALDLMKEHGIVYDSSAFPIAFHPDYGMPDAPLGIYRHSNSILELPMSCVDLRLARVPCSGGAYFRHFPYWLTRRMIQHCHTGSRPVIFYLHPWEIDPEQPRIALPRGKRFRHYRNLDSTFNKLEQLMRDFSFTSVRSLVRNSMTGETITAGSLCSHQLLSESRTKRS